MPTYDFFDHDRFVMVRATLGIGPAQLFGHVALFERWLTRFHITGDISGIEGWRIEVASGWLPPEVPDSRAGEFDAAMRKAGLIHISDGRTLVRGWPANAPEFVKKRLSRLESNFSADNGGQRRPVAASGVSEQSRAEQSGDELRRAESAPPPDRSLSASVSAPARAQPELISGRAREGTDVEAEKANARNFGARRTVIMLALHGVRVDDAFVSELASSPLELDDIREAGRKVLAQNGVTKHAGYLRRVLENDYGFAQRRKR